MQLELHDPNGAPWNEAALIAIGASTVTWPADSGPVVEPTIDLAGYSTAAAAAIAESLQAYAASVRFNLETAGIVVSGVKIATDDRSKQMIMGARIAAAADSGFTTPWVDSDGNITTLNASQIVAISNAVLDHVQGCFTKFATVSAGIADNTITSREQIDAAFA